MPDWVTQKPDGTIEVDLSKMDLETGAKNWLSPQGRIEARAAALARRREGTARHSKPPKPPRRPA
jgi:hypothetical protein